MSLESPVTGMELAKALSGVDEGGSSPTFRGPRPANPNYNIPLSGPTTYRGIRFDSVVHAVNDLGWDDNYGSEVNLPKDNSTLVVVPDGTYKVGRNIFYGIREYGIVGLGPNVTFRPPDGNCCRAIQISSNDRGEDFLLENIEFDQTNDNATGYGISLNVTDGLQVRHCSRTGQTPNRYNAGGPLSREPWGMVPTVSDPQGRGIVSHWTDHTETIVVGYPRNGASIFSGVSNQGTLRIEDTSIRNQGEHAIYASKADDVEIVHCEFVNNANTNLRIAGEGSFAENSIFGFDRDAQYTAHADEPGKKATKILRSENELVGESGGYYENCEFYCETPGLSASILAYFMGSVGGQEMRDCIIRNEVDDDGAVIDAIGSGWRGKVPPGADWIKFINCDFVGASNHPPIDADRPGLVHAINCYCDMPNAPRAEGLATHDINYAN